MRKVLFLCAALFFASLQPVLAQSWPSRPVHLVVPYAPGGNVDIASRLIGQALQRHLKQPIVVENRAGAGGMVAANYVAKSEADGYTIFVGGNGPLLFSPVIAGKTDFNWQDDFVAVGPINLTPMVLVVHPSVPVKSIKEFLGYARKNKLFMVSGGMGSTNHLTSELIQAKTGVRWETAHYKGNVAALTALVRGDGSFGFEQVTSTAQFIRDGKLKPVVTTAGKRLPTLPDVPTMAEEGMPEFEAASFLGLFAPVKTPPQAVRTLSEALAKARRDKEVVDRLDSLGSQPFNATQEEFLAYIKGEQERWLPVIKNANIKAN